MRTIWKVLLGLALTLPLAVYVTGMVLASRAAMPADRTPVVIDDAPFREAGRVDGGPAAGSGSEVGRDGDAPPPPPPGEGDDDRGADDDPDDRDPGDDMAGDDREVDDSAEDGSAGDDSEDRDDDHGVQVIRPTPNDLDDDEDGDRVGDDDGDDLGGGDDGDESGEGSDDDGSDD